MRNNVTQQKAQTPRRTSRALRDARAWQRTRDKQLQAELAADPAVRLSCATHNGFELAREDAREAVERYDHQLKVIDAARVAGQADDKAAENVHALIERRHAAETERFEAYGLATAEPKQIRTLIELRQHIEDVLSNEERCARAYGHSATPRDCTAINGFVRTQALNLFKKHCSLKPPPSLQHAHDPGYLPDVMHWCRENENLPEVIQLTNRVIFNDQVKGCETALRLYAAVRRELFATLRTLARHRAPGWEVRFTCAVAGAPTEIMYRLEDAESDQLRPEIVVDMPGSIMCLPFRGFVLQRANGSRPRAKSGAHHIERKLEYLLGRLYVICSAIKTLCERVRDEVALYSRRANTAPLALLVENMPAFPYWPCLSRDRSEYDRELTHDESIVASARQALEAIIDDQALLTGYAVDPSRFLPFSAFKREIAKLLAHATEPGRQSKRVRFIHIAGEKRYNVDDARLNWGDPLRPPGE